ncbi:MAG: hypothetical protein RR057_00730, partial [Clostridia bacterium]
MKKILSSLLAITLVIGMMAALSACGKKENDNSKNASTASTASKNDSKAESKNDSKAESKNESKTESKTESEDPATAAFKEAIGKLTPTEITDLDSRT